MDAPKPYDVVVLDWTLQNCEDPISVFEELRLVGARRPLALSTAQLDHPVHRLLAYDDPGWSDPCVDLASTAKPLLCPSYVPNYNQ